MRMSLTGRHHLTRLASRIGTSPPPWGSSVTRQEQLMAAIRHAGRQRAGRAASAASRPRRASTTTLRGLRMTRLSRCAFPRTRVGGRWSSGPYRRFRAGPRGMLRSSWSGMLSVRRSNRRSMISVIRVSASRTSPSAVPIPEDRVGLWHVAGTGPLNRAMEMARGRWIAVLNDDDALRPDHISTLLEVARTNHVEVAYGSILQHRPDETTIRHGSSAGRAAVRLAGDRFSMPRCGCSSMSSSRRSSASPGTGTESAG